LHKVTEWKNETNIFAASKQKAMIIKSIQNIIFDLGGVVLNIDPKRTIEAFRNLGYNDFYLEDTQLLSKQLFYNLEKGNSSPTAFRASVRHMIKNYREDQEIDDAWTAMILDIPADRVRYLEELKKSYRTFLLSNTNAIHVAKFHRNFETDFGYPLYNLFEHNFYSHEMGLRKPDPQIYLDVLEEANLVPEETLFIDDMEENIEVAESLGMKVLHIQPGTLMEKLPGYLNDNR